MKNILLFLLFVMISELVYPQLTYRLTSELAEQLQCTLNKQGGDLSTAVIFPNGDICQGLSGFSYDTMSIKKEMLFNIGSITKTFTAAAILKLVDDNSIRTFDQSTAVIIKWS